MKRFFLVLTALTLGVGCSKNNDETANGKETATTTKTNGIKNDLQRENLKGKVKWVKLTEYRGVKNNGKIEKKIPIENEVSLKTYDKEGYLTQFSGDNTDDGYRRFSLPYPYIFYSYLFYSKIGRIGENKILYNDKGLKIEEKSEKYLLKYTYTYDEASRAIERKGGGTTIFIKYDDKDNVIEENIIDTSRYFPEKFLYKYDNNGRMVEKLIENKNASSFYTKYENVYNDNNDIVEEIVWRTEYQATKHKTIYEEYDSQGNWTRKTWIEEGRDFYIYEREIEYY